MKVTKSQLKKIIKEELESVLGVEENEKTMRNEAASEKVWRDPKELRLELNNVWRTLGSVQRFGPDGQEALTHEQDANLLKAKELVEWVSRHLEAPSGRGHMDMPE